MDAIDIMIYENGNGGDINLKNQDIEMVKGLTNQIYLALFSGNVEQITEEQSAFDTERFDYWGNNYLQKEQQYNSHFEKALAQTVLTSAGLIALENAAKKDLSYFGKYAEISVKGYIADKDRLEMYVEVKQKDIQNDKIKFIWDGTRKEIIEFKKI